MHAVLVQLQIDPSRAEEAISFLRERAVPMISKGEGFQSGTWMRSLDGAATRSLLLYDSEESAKAAATRAAEGPPPGAPTTFVSAEVFEVIVQT
jgi:hypothetical protein